MVRESIAHFLAESTGFAVTHCGSVQEAMIRLRSSEFDLLLLDYDLGQQRATDLLSRLGEVDFHGPVVILTAHLSDLAAKQVVRMGVSGILLKSDSIAELGSRLRAICDGATWFDIEVKPDFDAANRTAQSGRVEFTPREKEAMQDLVNGFSNKEIAMKYDLSESSIKATIQRLFRKTGARTRSQLVRLALEKYLDSI